MKSVNIFLAPAILTTILTLPGCFESFRSKSEYKDPTKFKKLAKNLYVDFDTSMQSSKYGNKIETNKPLFEFLRYNYENHSFNNVVPQDICKIPKIFHYIWLGKKLPEQFQPFLETWLKYQPDWTFIFWVDNPENYNLGEFKELDFDGLQKYLQTNDIKAKRIVLDVKGLNFDNKQFFDTTRNYGQRSDILKWEVVYRFGGVYIDVDFECMRPLDLLHHMYDFYTGIQPLDTSFIQLGAALFGARAYHPILKRCVETIKDDWHHQQIVLSTGPLHFTKSFCESVNDNTFINVALPASFFYPCGYDEQKLPRKNWIKSEAFAAHHWAGSWLKPEGWDPKGQ